jgi:hypothetical protein
MKVNFDFAAERDEAVFDVELQVLRRYDTVAAQPLHRRQRNVAIRMPTRQFGPKVQVEHQCTHAFDRIGDALDRQPFDPAFHAAREHCYAIANVHVKFDIVRAAVALERIEDLPT